MHVAKGLHPVNQPCVAATQSTTAQTLPFSEAVFRHHAPQAAAVGHVHS
jgi:hypothetical protein